MEIKPKQRINELTNEQKIHTKSFLGYEKSRGIKRTDNLAPKLKPLFEYLSDNGLEYRQIGIREAQEFQTHLSTMEEPEGAPHYATLTVTTLIAIASRFYNYLKAAGLVATNPFIRIKRIRTEKRLPRNIPREKELAAFLERFRRFWERKHLRERRMYYKVHVIAELMYATGMRIREVLGLKAADIDFRNRTIRVRDDKKGRERTAYLNEYAAAVLLIYADKMRDAVNRNRNVEAVFGLENGASIVAIVNKYLVREGKAEGIGRFTSHNFRHSLGFHLLRRGCDMRYIQLILGHEDMNTTTIYTKVEKSDLRHELDRFHPRKQPGGKR
jgi:site-specific recombinase XerD